MRTKLHRGANDLLFQQARELRNNETHAELVLWGYLRTKPSGYKFRRQHPYGIHILDFYCHKLKLVIEVDGSIHSEEEVKRNDEERQRILEADGLIIKRFTNKQVLKKLETVISDIDQYISDKNERN